jgi:hypothetical protein
MRLALLALCCLLVPAQRFSAQQPAQNNPAPKPHKVLTPEQKAYQQQYRQFNEERMKLLAQGKQAYEAEIAREKAGDKAGECKDAGTTYDWNICLGRDATITEANYTAFTAAIRALLALKVPAFPGEDQNFVGMTGKPLTSEEQVKEFDTLESLWQKYLERATSAAYDQFKGGTLAPSFEVQCRRDLMRSHMHELHLIYGDLWM